MMEKLPLMLIVLSMIKHKFIKSYLYALSFSDERIKNQDQLLLKTLI